ncbi:MAG: RluA family pseudouridine synthase [Candidatus Omnitrophica bacterium]|nr:RluA family pseudouridine synthase [Candidatus Omnitrophota bacterium]
MNIPIIYEDDWFLVVDKPAGLVTIPTPRKESRTLTSVLNADLAQKAIAYRLHPCHRLDRQTSGLIIYAKGKSSQRMMMDEFRQKRVKKVYLAFVQGALAKNQGEIKTPIEGQAAVTQYRVIQKRKGFTILEARPLTGRTNQLRIHFKAIGHPILGDTKFALRREFKVKARRLCLHARALEFIHPINKKIISLRAELPKDLQEFLGIPL